MDHAEIDINQLRSTGKSWDEIEQILIGERLMDPQQVARSIAKLKKEYHDLQVKSGKTKIIVGVVLLGINFLISCINFHADLPFETIMYGFTTAGIAMLLWGAYDCLH